MPIKKNFSGDTIEKLYELYNFAKPGATIEFVAKNYQNQIDEYYREGANTTVILSIGLNNSKAEIEADNYVSTLEEFQELMRDLLKGVKDKVNRLIVIEYIKCDEVKTMPKINPLNGTNSFFSNKRSGSFNQELIKICNELSVETVCVDIEEDEWVNNYLFEDGLHPNDKGHKAIFDQLIKSTDI